MVIFIFFNGWVCCWVWWRGNLLLGEWDRWCVMVWYRCVVDYFIESVYCGIINCWNGVFDWW